MIGRKRGRHARVRRAAAHAATARPVSWRALGGVGRLWARPRHAATHQLRVAPAAACLGSLALVVTGATLGSLGTGGALAATTAAPAVTRGHGQDVSIMDILAKQYAARRAAPLPPATAPPLPAPPSLAGSPVLRPHEVFGFAPYWTLPAAGGFDVAGMTTLAYFSVDVNADGTVAQTGPGWVGYQSQALADLVTRAHGAGDRVVLTATCFDPKALDSLAADAGAQTRLAAALVQLVGAKNLDGVNIDFEGQGPKDRAGLDRLMAAVSAAMRGTDPHWQVTMDTYASSAGDPQGFYDVAGLAPSVDGFFVMAYDMNDPATPSPTAPLTGAGFTDLDAVQQYAAVVSPAKVILGVPYYGYDWPTAGPGLGDPATGPATPLSYAQVLSNAGHVYWDPTTQTPWTSYLVGTQWHQTWYDDPTSLALKAQLADTYHLAGLGIWALGMEGGAPAMLAALRGNAPVVKTLTPGPVGTALAHPAPTTTLPSNYFFAGTWNGVPVTLAAVDPTSIPGAPSAVPAGRLTGFATNDPSRLCLETGPGLAVGALPGVPGAYLVTATTPTDCAAGAWVFSTVPAGAATTTTTRATTTTTTTSTTTTAPPPPSTTTTPAG